MSDQRLQNLEGAIAGLRDELARVRVLLGGEMDAQRLEIATLKDFLDANFPDFQHRYPAVRESSIRADRSERESEELPSGA